MENVRRSKQVKAAEEKPVVTPIISEPIKPSSDYVAVPLKVPKTGELVARTLRNKIIRGELKEGSSLPAESELMAQFQISRPTLREALRILESEGLLTVRRGSRGGPTVNRPSVDIAARHFGLVLQSQNTTLADIFTARLMIEPPALGVVAEEASDRAPAILQAILDQEWEAFKAKDEAALTHLVARFHTAFIELTGNHTLILIMQILNSIYERHIAEIKITAGSEFDRIEQTKLGLKSQRKAIELIAAGDSDKIRPYWRTHLENVRKVMFRQTDQSLLIDILD
jgi:DNA-binding FadR family transcriptional regulator